MEDFFRVRRSLLVGIVAGFFVILIAALWSPLQTLTRTVWMPVFKFLGIENMYTPMFDIPLALLALYIIGRLISTKVFMSILQSLRALLVRSAAHPTQGIPIIFDQDNEGFRPGFARGETRIAGTFPYEYLVLCIMPVRGTIEGRFIPAARVWVVQDMRMEEFMPLYAIAGIVQPEKLTLIPWEQWQARNGK